MKKFLLYILIIALGSFGVYYGLTKTDLLQKKEEKSPKVIKPNKTESKNKIPSKDEFVAEATKLQTLAENKAGNNTCTCYSTKDIDPTTNLEGSILVYTIDDLFVSSLWLSNGYYLLDGTENASVGLLEETDNAASKYCGEASKNETSALCYTNY